MAPGFSFPPPPPPPPPKSSPQAYGAGRGAYHDGGRGRGRGHGRGMPGNGRGGYGHDGRDSVTTQYPAGSYINPHFRADGPPQRNTDQRDSRNLESGTHGQKRKRHGDDSAPTGSWRGNHTSSAGTRPHPMKQTRTPARSAIPPAVPSFGAPFSFSRPGQSPAATSSTSGLGSKAPGSSPGHGLPAPFADDSSDSESEDDADEEETFRDIAGEALKFEHDGEIIVLETLADLRAWQDERKTKFPTNRRIEQRDVERHARMEERRRIERETAAFFGYQTRYARDAAATGRQDNRPLTGSRTDEPTSGPEQPSIKNIISQNSPSAQHEATTTMPTTQPAALGLAGYASSSSRSPSPSPSNSSASASSDSGPELQSSKTLPADLPSRRICRNFSAPGGCRYGSRCTFEHVGEPGRPLPPRNREKREVKQGRERKTLYQRLVEQEQMAENRLALMAIRYLGDKGFFREMAPSS